METRDNTRRFASATTGDTDMDTGRVQPRVSAVDTRSYTTLAVRVYFHTHPSLIPPTNCFLPPPSAVTCTVLSAVPFIFCGPFILDAPLSNPWLTPDPPTQGSTTTSRVRFAVNWRTQMGQPGRVGGTSNARIPQMNCGYVSSHPHHLCLDFNSNLPGVRSFSLLAPRSSMHTF